MDYKNDPTDEFYEFPPFRPLRQPPEIDVADLRKHWERGDRKPRGAALTLLWVVRHNPRAVAAALLWSSRREDY